ncbi:MAG TPA: protease pro-enzyme activation domain-containing protein, partial [Streptosporangiaceae bacterium]
MSAAMLIGLAGAVVAQPALAATAGARVQLPDPVPTWTRYDTDDGPAGSSVTVPARIWLAGRAPAAETRFATAASTPGPAAYGRYLTPAQFTARFGATPAQAAAVGAWARSAGLTVVSVTAHYVAVTGSAPGLSAALDTSIHAYGNSSGALTGYAPVSGVSVPASIGADVSTVTGLDDYSYGLAAGAAAGVAHHASARPTSATPEVSGGASFACSHWWGQHVSAIPEAGGRTSAPDAVCGYTPGQLRSAYGVSGSSGTDATIAVVLDGSLSTMADDANRFFARYHVPGFAPGQFTVNTGPGFASSCAGSSDVPEEPLDVETAHIIAPAAKVVYVAANCSQDSQVQQQNLLDAETRIVDLHLADVSTDSYSIVENGDFTPAAAAAWTAIFEQGAAEGIGFGFDSGDGGDDGGAGVTFPASDPWATAAGGTTLQIGRTGAVTGELGWGDNGAEENAAGTGYQQAPPGTFEQGSTGGRSSLFPQPAYQRGVVPASLSTDGGTRAAGREVPDVAADASPMTGWMIGYTTPGGRYGTQLEGGTSGASPIVAALEADAKRPAGHAIGFANPLLYDLRTTAGIRDIVPSASPALTLAPDCYNDQVAPNPACLVTLGPDSSLTE